MNLQIHNHNFDLTESFQEYLQMRFDSLDKYQEKIIYCKVELSRDQKHQKGEVYTVEAHLGLPNKNTLTVRETHSDARAAVDLVQDKLARQLRKFKDKYTSKARKKNKYFKSLKFWSKKE